MPIPDILEYKVKGRHQGQIQTKTDTNAKRSCKNHQEIIESGRGGKTYHRQYKTLLACVDE